jgi:hypothetical protein
VQFIEDIVMLFTTLRFIFLQRPLHVSFLRYFWHAIRTHVHVPCKKKDFIDYIYVFWIFIKTRAYELGSRKTMSTIYVYHTICVMNNLVLAPRGVNGGTWRLPCRPLGDTGDAQTTLAAISSGCPPAAGGARLAKCQRVKEAFSGNEAERRSHDCGRVRLRHVEAEVSWWRRSGADPGISSAAWRTAGMVGGGCGGCVLGPGGLLRQWAGPSSPLLPASGVGAADLDRIMVAVLRFFSRQDEDLSDSCPHWYGFCCIFQKASPVNTARRFIPGDC